MPDNPLAIVILAAGKGTRMDSDMAKVLHPLGQAPMLWHVLDTAMALEPARIVVVVGHDADAVAAAAEEHCPAVEIVRQDEQLGTGHAVRTAGPTLDGFEGRVMVLYGDTPFVAPETLEAMRDSTADVAILGFEAAEPGRYGRLILDGEAVDRIVEAKDASPEELAITLCNSGVVSAPGPLLFDLLSAVGNDNAAGEYYLTDIVGLARGRGLSTAAVICPEDETRGINSPAELAAAEAVFQARTRARLVADGVTMLAPDTVHFAFDTHVGRGAVLEPYLVFGPGVTVETGATIRAFSHLEGAHVSQGAIVGPYARLRPGAELAEDARIGNFVEVKAAEIGAGAKVNHLSYIGDATIGAGTNVGAGTVTCNYDGVMKHRTEIGERAFIGSNTMLVAPVRIGDEALTASGSVITEDVPDGALAVARGRQVNKPGLARRLMARLRDIKAGKG
ncbi:bifunctional UDP-N-acetylglucosamine diphosphorylase/glucosamine-1-phosphate N-acetyltransferase GlmU [Rhodobacterales bacterium HKCCE3408]|nr:bifunctional UDP-N-acetylglucosamine diphosphorylase/glucosamine-1-phosphate N-acetyltransferase GlmU [Rhodobacterales bacterium HKCCE3408]